MNLGHMLIGRNGNAEDITIDGLMTLSVVGRSAIRPVYCPKCGLHYTMPKPPGQGSSIAHVECLNCAEGLPRAEDVQ